MKRRFTLYNRPAVLIFSILLSGFCGALMLGYNLRATGKRKIVLPLIIITLIADGIMYKMMDGMVGNSLIRLLIPNTIAGVILAYPIWDIYVAMHANEFLYKPVWIPVIVTFVLYGSLFVLNMVAPLSGFTHVAKMIWIVLLAGKSGGFFLA